MKIYKNQWSRFRFSNFVPDRYALVPVFFQKMKILIIAIHFHPPLTALGTTVRHMEPKIWPIPNPTLSAGKSWNEWFSSVPSTPTTENYAANEVSRPKRLPRKNIFYFQNFENRCILHIFRVLKIWIFMILAVFFTHFNRDPYRKWSQILENC